MQAFKQGWPMATSATQQAHIALNRFGLGARPGEAKTITSDPRGWLLQQLDTDPKTVPASMQKLPDTPATMLALKRRIESNLLEKHREQGRKPRQAQVEAIVRTDLKGDFLAEIHARGIQQVTTETPFLERLVMFWSNHFAISAEKSKLLAIAGSFEREAVRPRVLGTFSDLLLAVEQHPGMLRYLDNIVSIGDDSAMATDPQVRRRYGKNKQTSRMGVNENLAREILELHTLGVNGGYKQADVVELAKTISGWSVTTREGLGEARGPYGFVWYADTHEPGERTILGKHYPAGGLEQGESVLRDLARHPSTADFIATKLARHFTSDEPPASLVRKLRKKFLDDGGELKPLYRALIESDEAWKPDAAKFKRPEEFLISALRAGGLPPPEQPENWAEPLTVLGQAALQPRSPAGWSDRADDWVGSNGLWKRVQLAEALAGRIPDGSDPAALAVDALGPQLHDDTVKVMAGAESPQQAVALLLSSPEFQWR